MAEENEVKAETAPSASRGVPSGFRFIMGEKIGMTQAYDNNGRIRGVSVVRAGPCPILRVKSSEGPDGYDAVLMGYGSRKEKNISQPVLGRFKKAGTAPTKWIKEFRIKKGQAFEVGQVASLDAMFKPGDYVDVRGTSKGKGFAGAMKRHNFAGLPASHGASDKQRSPGSLASRRSLGRVLPGQRMAGHMGAEAACVAKVEVIKVLADENLVYLNGSVPGPRGGMIVLSETVKSRKSRIEVVRSTVKKDKMGNIISAKKPSKAKPA